MDLVLEHAADPFEVKPAASLEQNTFFRETRAVYGPQEVLRRQVKLLAAVEIPCMAENFVAYADQFGDAVVADQLGDPFV